MLGVRRVTRSLDLPALDRIDTLAQELAMLQDTGKRRIAILGSRHVPVVSIHLVELVARSLAQEGHNLITSGAQGVNSAVIRSVLAVDPGRLTVLLPQSLDRQPSESRDQLEQVMHLVEKPEHDELPLPMASSLCNQEIINRCDQLICYAFHDSETLLSSCRTAEDMGKVVSLLFFD
ncbi:MAG: DNA recombination-mediator protein A [Cyanobium sp.]